MARILLLLLAAAARAAVVLSIDINDATDTPTDTAPGFADYTLAGETLSVPPFTIDLNPAGGALLDDVHRTTPATTGALMFGALYRDCAFAAGHNTASFYRVGIDTLITGLTAGKKYTLTAWSYDSGATTTRTSDWSVIGLGGPQFAVNDYAFIGTTTPANDTANRFTVTAYADESGRLTLRGRQNAPATAPQVFLNGFTIDELAPGALTATARLAIDFNDRGAAGGANTFAGFSEFLLSGTEGVAQTATTRTFGTHTATLTAIGGTMDDRVRAAPVNSGPFTDSLLLRDFVFGTNTADLDLRVQGLNAGAEYLVELWSFDSGSTTLRTADWTVNGATLWEDYVFNGLHAPATNDDAKLVGAFTANASGELLISGRVVGAAVPAVFLNAVRISELAPAPIVDLGRPIISEFLAENAEGITDEDGDTSDWIEIWNTTAGTLNLAGWHLTDDAALHTKWTFPAGVSLPSQARLIVWASGKNRTTNPAALHTNFALNKGTGSYLALFQPGGATAATEFSALPSQREDIAYGLSGTSDPLTAGYFQPPTPGGPNGTPVPGFVSDTVFDVNRGFFTPPFAVHISCATPGAAIHYTLDGSEPTSSSAAYPGAAGIPISATTVLRAKAFAPPLAPSNTDTQTYIFNAQVQNQPAAPAGWPATWGVDSEVAANNGGNGTVPADYEMDPNVVNSTQPGYGISDALAALPALSITMNPADFHSIGGGIYTNPKSVGDAWEKACSIELLEPGGGGFHTSCGIRVHGNSSRRPFRMQKHSFRLAFRDVYGDGKLDYKLFDDTTLKEFDKLVLHAFFTDGWGLVSWDAGRYRPDTALNFRDAFVKRSFADMGHARVSGRHLHLYINGLYWGIYEAGERVDDVWCADHFGGIETDWDVIAPGEGVYVRNGTAAAWDGLFTFVNAVDLTQSANYEQAASQVDLADFVDYYLLHVHADSEDWPHHNGYAVRNRVSAGAQWRFVPWDQEIAFDPLVLVDRLSNSGSNNIDKTAGRLLQRLRTSAEFRLLFADRAHRHLHNGGALSVGVEQARWQVLADSLDKAIVAESARWGDTADATPYGNAVAPANQTLKRETHWLPQVSAVKNSHFPGLHNRANSYATITELAVQNLWPSTEPPVFGQFGGNVPSNYSLTITASAGQIYYTLDGSDPRTAYTGAAHGTLYSSPITLSQTCTAKARALNGGVWSALTEATFIVGTAAAAGNLAVTELHYNPATDADHEFIELMNFSTVPIDLTGVHFEGITFTFADGTLLDAGERIVVVRNAAAFAVQYGVGPRVGGEYTGALDNPGEEIAVLDANDADIVRFTYDDTPPWPTAPDGAGRSLVLRAPTLDPTNPFNWRSSAATGGNPGGTDGVAFTGTALADLDRDGLVAALEYSLGGNDTSPNDLPRPVVAIESFDLGGGPQNYLTVTARQNLAADGATLVAEFSTNLSVWSSGVVYLGESIDGNGIATRRWRAATPRSADARQFLRVNAMLP